MKILNRWNGAVLFEDSQKSLRLTLMAAIAARAVLTDADLTDADLTGAGLTGAVLTDAVLTDADLRGAVLRGAVLRGADLTDAVLRGAVLTDAVLRGAVLTDADLTDADLTDADLTGAVLRGAVLRGADLTGADLRGAVLPRIPKLARIDAAILEAIGAEGCKLDMSYWHQCDTTHCRSGWAIHLCGEAGYVLEGQVGSATAGALIYAVSRPGKPVPDFRATNEAAMEDMRKCAEEQA